MGYRRGSNTQYVNQVYIKVLDYPNVYSLVGCRVRVVDGYGNTYLGKVIKVHGRSRNSVVIATFNRNVPGQVIGGEATFYRTS